MKYKSLKDILIGNSTIEDKGLTFITDSEHDRFVSFQGLYRNAISILYYLQNEFMLKPNDKVLFQIPGNVDFINIYWACMLGGIIPVPLSFANSDELILKLLNVWQIIDKAHIVLTRRLVSKLQEYLGSDGHELIGEIKKKAIFIEDITAAYVKGIMEGKIHDSRPNDIAFIQFSSGSTGDPKGVVLTHENLLVNMHDIAQASQCTPEDSFLSWMPLTHDMGMIGFHLTPFYAGFNQYIMSTFVFSFYPMTWLRKAHEYKVSVLACPNFGYEHLLSCFMPEKFDSVDLSRIRIIFNGAEPISHSLCAKFAQTLQKYGLRKEVITPVYGLAEAGLTVTFSPPQEAMSSYALDRTSLSPGDKIKLVSHPADQNRTNLVDVGTPLKSTLVEICDERGKKLPVDTVGLVHIKGKNVTRGYFNNKKATRKAISDDGWLNTGDLGFFRGDHLVVVGRQKEVILLNGQNYYPGDIERLAQQIEGVHPGKVAVCGIQDKHSQSDEMVLFVLSRKKLETFIPIAARLKSHINNKTGFKVKHVVPVNKIPVTTSGKVRRLKLRQEYLDGMYSQVIERVEAHLQAWQHQETKTVKQGVYADEIEQDILQTFNRSLGKASQCGLHDNFMEICADSLLLAKIAAELERYYPDRVSVTDFFAYPTIHKLAQHIEKRQHQLEKHVSVNYIRLPGSYIVKRSGSGATYKFNMNKEIFSRLKRLLHEQKVELSDIMISSYLLLFSKIINNRQVSIQVAFDQRDKILPLNVDLSDVEDLLALIGLVRAEKCKNDLNSLNDLQEFAGKRNENEILPLLYRKSFVSAKRDLTRTFDIAVGIDEKDEYLDFTLEYNDRLRKEKIEELINDYLSIINSIISTYVET